MQRLAAENCQFLGGNFAGCRNGYVAMVLGVSTVVDRVGNVGCLVCFATYGLGYFALGFNQVFVGKQQG